MFTKQTNTLFILLTFFFSPIIAFGHGENQPGPHGGYIRMPGPMHTEVLPIDSDSLKIYLLDTSIRNPVTENSSVEAALQNSNGWHELTCTTEEKYFHCSLPRNENLDDGLLIISPVRQNVRASDAIYDLPLSFQ